MTEKKLSLIEITGSLTSIIDRIVENGGEVDEATFAELQQWQGNLEVKAEQIAYMIKSVMDSRINRLKELKKKIDERKNTEENAQQRLKNYLQSAMEAADMRKIKGDIYTVSVASGKDAVEIMSENEIPAQFVTIEQKIKPDKKAILEALKNGEEIPGVKLIRTPDHLTIR